MNYIKMSPLAGLTGYGGGSTALPFSGAAGYVAPTPTKPLGTRGITSGGNDGSGSYQNDIEYCTIPLIFDTATDFGDLTVARQQLGSASNGTRAIPYCGYANNANKN